MNRILEIFVQCYIQMLALKRFYNVNAEEWLLKLSVLSYQNTKCKFGFNLTTAFS